MYYFHVTQNQGNFNGRMSMKCYKGKYQFQRFGMLYISQLLEWRYKKFFNELKLEYQHQLACRPCLQIESLRYGYVVCYFSLYALEWGKLTWIFCFGSRNVEKENYCAFDNKINLQYTYRGRLSCRLDSQQRNSSPWMHSLHERLALHTCIQYIYY